MVEVDGAGRHIGRDTVAEHTVVALGRAVDGRCARAFTEAPVADQARLATCQHGVVRRLDLAGAALDIPDPHLVDQAGEALARSVLAAADGQVVHRRVDVADSARAVVGVDQRAVDIGLYQSAVVRHGEVDPGVGRHRVGGVHPVPRRRRVGERPLQLAGSRDGDLVFAFLVDDDLVGAERAGALHRCLDRERRGHHETRLWGHHHQVGSVERECAVRHRRRFVARAEGRSGHEHGHHSDDSQHEQGSTSQRRSAGAVAHASAGARSTRRSRRTQLFNLHLTAA